jgi:hypothetical protein
MADSTNTTGGQAVAQGQGAATGGQAQDQGTEVKLYDDRAAAESAKPTEGKKRLFEVAKDGKSRWLWANGYDHALATAARADGYSVGTGNTKEVTKEAVAARLAQFTDDELAAMGLTRQKSAPADGGVDLSAPPPADDDAGTPETGRKGRRGRKSAETDAQ